MSNYNPDGIDKYGQKYTNLHNAPEWFVWKNIPMKDNPNGSIKYAEWDSPLEERTQGIFTTLNDAEKYFNVKFDLSLQNRIGDSYWIILEGNDSYVVIVGRIPLASSQQIQEAIDFYSKLLPIYKIREEGFKEV